MPERPLRRSRPSARRRRPYEPEATRGALIGAATREFSRRGFAGARTAAIARVAKVNKALIRYHFGGKRGLYNAVFLDGLEAGGRELERRTAELLAVPAAERIGRLIDLFAAFYESNPELAFLLTREQMDGAAQLDRETIEALFVFFGTTRRLLDDGGGDAGAALRRLDPHHVHLALVGSLLFFRLTAPARERYAKSGLLRDRRTTALSWSEHVEVVKTLALSGLLRPIEPPARRRTER